MTPEQFLQRCKALWHVGPLGSWERIARHGLRTAQQLIDGATLDDEMRARLTREPRAAGVPMRIGDETVVLRDQEPLTRRKDLGALLGEGVTVADWMDLLNRRVYLFTDRVAKDKLVTKYAAIDGCQEVLAISPMRLLEVARHRLELADQNTGAIKRTSAAYKDRHSFVPLSQFPDRVPKEVTIVDGLEVDEIRRVVHRVERVHADRSSEPLDLWQDQ